MKQAESFTFHNLTVSIEARTGAAAYATLSAALEEISCAWSSDTFSEDWHSPDTYCTSRVFPNQKER